MIRPIPATRLKLLRIAFGISQQHVAETLHITEAQVSNFEHNRRRPSTEQCFQIAKIFGIDPGEIWPERFGRAEAKNEKD